MEQKRFEKQYLDPKDYEDIERAAKWAREHFPWLVKIGKLFIKD